MKRRCLIVDDSEDVRLLMGLGLGQAGFEVVGEAQNASSALEAAQDTHPDIVLVDLMIPGAEGLDTITSLRGLLPDASIVVCSGRPAHSMAAACLDAGADHYVEKDDLLDIGAILTGLLDHTAN